MGLWPVPIGLGSGSASRPKVAGDLGPSPKPRGLGAGSVSNPYLGWLGVCGSWPHPKGLGLRSGSVAILKVGRSKSIPKVVGELGFWPDSRELGAGSLSRPKSVGGWVCVRPRTQGGRGFGFASASRTQGGWVGIRT
ncbi:hypothetical protein NC653_011437 [Populus alba x Populus x berolinensis]|uniref:Uncharacterized protein n=1 Tax=Populus alba x Populus x berolinensis TaxID=444605 RepID=A0AAD6R2G1_9ROSI|nr:hypothetical protein NC653_011437 [Populus alba x Populus x berolinensis]